ncbi:MAG: hypothetical protein ABIP20_08845 [Chthoniobacteraceae bacterium]
MNHCRHIFCVLILSICTSTAQSPKSDKEPERLVALRKSWQQARTKATEPIDLKYRQELLKILESLTKAGDLNGALTVKQELDGLNTDNASVVLSDTGHSLLARLRGTTWRMETGEQFTFKDGKEVTWDDTNSHKIFPMKIEQMKDGSLSIPWGRSKGYRLEVAADHSLITLTHADRPDKIFTATPITKKKP